MSTTLQEGATSSAPPTANATEDGVQWMPRCAAMLVRMVTMIAWKALELQKELQSRYKNTWQVLRTLKLLKHCEDPFATASNTGYEESESEVELHQ